MMKRKAFVVLAGLSGAFDTANVCWVNAQSTDDD
jgi:hypothetical protein